MSYRVYLYNEIPKEDLDLEGVLAYLGKHCAFAEIEVRGNFISHFFSPELLKGLADAWHQALTKERGFAKTEEERLEYEQQAYLEPETISPKIIYRGWQLLELLQAQIPKAEACSECLHLFLTPRLLVTKNGDEQREHARTLLAGQPSIISSSGLVEAPARPVEYYFLQRIYQMAGQEIPLPEIKKRFAGQFLVYHDPRLSQLIPGYLLQAIAYRFTGEGFCKDPRCRLFNAHRQQEMLSAQLEPPEFCPRHQALFPSP